MQICGDMQGFTDTSAYHKNVSMYMHVAFQNTVLINQL